MSQYGVAIIGGGAAGLSAALVLSRARRTVLLVDAGTPRDAPSTHMYGYLSRAGGFFVHLDDGQQISAWRMLLSTGLRDVLPDIPGLRDRWSRDVAYCPYGHGHEVRDYQLGVLGGTASDVRYAQIVRQWTHDLVHFTPSDRLTATERAELIARAIGTVEQLVPNDLLLGLDVDVDSDGWAIADSVGRTSVPGVWSAGNVIEPRAQVGTAAGAGSAAAIALNADLSNGLRPRRTPNTHPKETP